MNQFGALCGCHEDVMRLNKKAGEVAAQLILLLVHIR